MEERLQKLLSAYGAASRRGAEELIAAGRVTVNGAVARLGQKADPERDKICLDGRPLAQKPEPRYLMLYKPRGFVTTLSDEHGRPTAAELVADCGTRVYPVGRLDQYSEGLLVFTNDGDAAYRLAHPRFEVHKTYLAWVNGWRDAAIDALRAPIPLEEGTVQAVSVRLVQRQGDVALAELTIREGKNRQIRRMCTAAGLTVTRLKRMAEGELRLGDLKSGTWRELTPAEVQWLRRL